MLENMSNNMSDKMPNSVSKNKSDKMSDTMGDIMPDRSSKNMSDRVSVGGDRPKKVIFLYPSYIWWSRADMTLPAQTCYNPDLLRCSCRPVSRKQGKPSRSSAGSQAGDWNGRPKAWRWFWEQTTWINNNVSPCHGDNCLFLFALKNIGFWFLHAYIYIYK